MLANERVKECQKINIFMLSKYQRFPEIDMSLCVPANERVKESQKMALNTFITVNYIM